MNIFFVVLILESFWLTFGASDDSWKYRPRISKFGQCGEDTILTCASYDVNFGDWTWYIAKPQTVSIRGAYNETVHEENKYTAYVENNVLTFIIHNTSAQTDETHYLCYTGRDNSGWIFLGPVCGDSGKYKPRISKGGQCGEDTVLTCATYSNEFGYWRWGIGRNFYIRGAYNATIHEDNKYTAYVENNVLTLIIHNTSAPTDATYYTCYTRNKNRWWIYVPIECKASSADFIVKDDKKLEITVDKLYPENGEMDVTLTTEGGLSVVHGETTCVRSSQHRGYIKCIWCSSNSMQDGYQNVSVVVTTLTEATPLSATILIGLSAVHGETTCVRSSQHRGYIKCIWCSSNSMQDGYQNVSVVVTTLTEANPLSATILIATPDIPRIENVYNIQGGAEVIFGAISNNLTVTCTSEGGSPRQTVMWYIDTVSTDNELATSSYADFVLENDDTNRVTIKYTFLNADMSLHGRTLICRSYYPKADKGFQGSKQRSVEIYLIGNIPTECECKLPLISLISGSVGGLSIVVVIAIMIVVLAYRRMCCFSSRRDNTAGQQEEIVMTPTVAAEYRDVPRISAVYEIPDFNPEQIPIAAKYEHLGVRDAPTTYEMLDSRKNEVCATSTRRK